MQRAASLGGSFFWRTGFAAGFRDHALCCSFSAPTRHHDMRARLDSDAEDRKERVFSQLSAVTRAIVYGTTVTRCCKDCFSASASPPGLPSPVVFGVLAALLSLLPWAVRPWCGFQPNLVVLRQALGLGIFLLVWGSGLSG